MTNLFCVFDSINIGKQFAATSHEKHMPKMELQKAFIPHEENTEGIRIQHVCLNLIKHDGVSLILGGINSREN